MAWRARGWRGGGWRRARAAELVAVGLIGLIVGVLIGVGVTALAAHVIGRHDAGPFRDRGHGYYQDERPGPGRRGGFPGPFGNRPNQAPPGNQNPNPNAPPAPGSPAPSAS